MSENSLRDKNLREQARALYFADYKIDQIAQTLDIPLEDVKTLAFGVDLKGSAPGCWKALKAAVGPAAVSAYIFEKRHVFERTTGLALSILNKSLTDLQAKVFNPNPDDAVELGLDDLRKLAGIVVDFDKIVRLETGQATEIVDNVGLSPQEARKILQNDPFARHQKKVERIEDAEINEDNENDGTESPERNSELHKGNDNHSLIYEDDAEDTDGS